MDVAPLDRGTGTTLFDRAIDPRDAGVAILARPGQRLPADLREGDLLLRLGRPDPQVAVLATPEPATGALPGRYAHLREADPQRLAGPDGLLLPDRMLLRLGPAAAEVLPPPVRPTIRNGSRGAAVAEAQARLNAIHEHERAAGRRGLDRCPLAVDGTFGAATRAATLSFQRRAFPDRPADWDGVIGPRTWDALDSFLRDRPPVPVEPVVHTPLDPPRWGPILAPHLSPRARLRTGNAVRALIDGPSTFARMADDIAAASGPRDYIYLLGWDNFDSFPLVPGRPATTFQSLYTAAAARGVEVAAMLWQQPLAPVNPARRSADRVIRRINALPGGKAILDDLTANNTLASSRQLKIALAAAITNPALALLILRLVEDDLARLGGSHHQKVLVVKRGETLVGYCGGIDMNPNRLVEVAPNTGQPHHDDHCRIVGPSAHDLLSTFLSRWRHHPASAAHGRLRGEAEPVPPPLPRPAAEDAPHGGSCSVIVARTFNPTRSAPPLVQRERDIKPLLLAAIAAARRFIYVEDQYLIDLDTADALRAALPRVAHVTVLIPGTPISDLPLGKEYRRDFVERVLRGLPASLAGRFGLFQLSSGPSAPPVFGRHTYVHAKSWVIDDELAVIGTANCNRRGYTFDSEVSAFIFDDSPPPPVLTALREGAAEVLPLGFSFAQAYRVDLWRHHLGLPAAALADGSLAGTFWRTRPPSARVVEFDHRLPVGTSRRAVLEQRIMDRAARELRNLIDPVAP